MRLGLEKQTLAELETAAAPIRKTDRISLDSGNMLEAMIVLFLKLLRTDG